MVEGAQRQGVSMRQNCKMLIIQRRRVLRWFEHQRDGQGFCERTAGTGAGAASGIAGRARAGVGAGSSGRVCGLFASNLDSVSLGTEYRGGIVFNDLPASERSRADDRALPLSPA